MRPSSCLRCSLHAHRPTTTSKTSKKLMHTIPLVAYSLSLFLNASLIRAFSSISECLF